MKILVTGNLGYIGSHLGEYFKSKMSQCELIGYDLGLFANCITHDGRSPDTWYDQQVYGDIRRFPEELLDGVDVIIHLAALSNDPIGERYDTITKSINQDASVRLAEKAVKVGVKHFLFASSCSVYGAGGNAARTEQDQVNPLTAYAKSKIGTEGILSNLNSTSMLITCLRFATACGYTKRLRLDLVLNDFVFRAFCHNKIQILSDGSPWRPLISVQDMCQAMYLLIKHRPENGNLFECVNVGSNSWNYQVKDLAIHVQKKLKNAQVILNQNAEPDKRSYRVNFDKFGALVENNFIPQTLNSTIENLISGLEILTKNRTKELRFDDYKRLSILEKVADEFTIWGPKV